MLRRTPSSRPRVLATRFGLNPNSSSLGVDVTFLLFGAGALSLMTPVIGALLRMRRPHSVEQTPHVDTPPPAGQS